MDDDTKAYMRLRLGVMSDKIEEANRAARSGDGEALRDALDDLETQRYMIERCVEKK